MKSSHGVYKTPNQLLVVANKWEVVLEKIRLPYVKRKLFGAKAEIQTQNHAIPCEPGLLPTSQRGAQGGSWVGREALPGPHWHGHSDAALSSRDGGRAPVPLFPLSFVEQQPGHSLLLISCLISVVPLGPRRRAPWLILGGDKDRGQGFLSLTGQVLALGKEGGVESQGGHAPTSPPTTL